MTLSLPSVWPVHDQATFNPIVVREKLITTVENAPASWADRLAELGFRKGQRAWLKLGAPTAAEFEYLSPELRLRSLHSADIVEAVDAEMPSLVPEAVRDQIVWLWQNNLDSVLFELGLMGVSTQGEAWDHLEATLLGDETEEADALIGLALAKLEMDGKLVGDVRSFAAAKGYPSGVDPTPAPAAAVVLPKGQSISWQDQDGVEQTGRLAGDWRTDDEAVWVYSDAFIMVNGYPVSPIGTVSASAISTPKPVLSIGAAIDYLSTWSTQVEAVNFDDASNASKELAIRFIRNVGRFPEVGWQAELIDFIAVRKAFVEQSTVQELLGQICSHLEALSHLYYGRTGVGFCLVGGGSNTESVRLSVGRFGPEGFYASEDSIARPEIRFSGDFDARQAAEVVHADLGIAAISLDVVLQAVGNAIGRPGGIPASVLTPSSRFMRSMAVARSLGTQEFTHDQLLLVLASVNRGRELLEAITAPAGSIATKILNQAIVTSSAGSTSHFTLELIEVSFPAVDQEEVLDLRGEIPDAHTNAEAKGYLILGSGFALDRGVVEALKAIPGTSLTGGTEARVVLLPDLASAIACSSRAIAALESRFMLRHEDVNRGKLLAERYPHYLQVRQAIAEFGSVEPQRAKAWLRNEFISGSSGRINAWPEGMLEQLVDVGYAQLLGNQGLAVNVQPKRGEVEGIPLSATDMLEQRDATLGSALAAFAKRHKAGVRFAVDVLSLINPELKQALSYTSALASSEQVKQPIGDYQDFGVVSGFSKKDLRSWGRHHLLRMMLNLAGDQAAKYLKKEIIWPRMSFEAMQAKGFDLKLAISLDLMWKATPKLPKSTSTLHMTGFVDLVTGMKQCYEDLIAAVLAGQIPGYRFHSAVKREDEIALGDYLQQLTRKVTSGVTVKSCYELIDFKVRGYPGLSIRSYAPFQSNCQRLNTELSLSTWDKYLTQRKVAPPAKRSRVLRDEVVREGPDYRLGRSITTEDFIKTFAFSGVEYGRWTSQNERERHINLAFDSMMDFSSLMGWDPMALSLGGKLGLCIGSRGTGGKDAAVAHFEPANFAMNLTRFSGDGNFGHEWIHALSLHFGLIHTGAKIDLMESFGYSLQKSGPLPFVNESLLREPVRNAFRDLLVSVMRQPREGGDPSEIEDYTNLSEMLNESAAMQGDYWSKPAEMFARAMESWTRQRMAAAGIRNDYLVRPTLEVGLYPDAPHLERINLWMAPLLESIQAEVREIKHPVLGAMNIPVLHSHAKARIPLVPQELEDIANQEVDRLFGKVRPTVQLYRAIGGGSGFYSLAEHLIGLNANCSDRGVIYHESWHACHPVLLSPSERSDLQDAFAEGAPLAQMVVSTMRDQGMPAVAIQSALESNQELQAYAFQLWATGRMELSGQALASFYRTRDFVDGVVDAAELVGADRAKQIFAEFLSGGMAARAEAGHSPTESVTIQLSFNEDQTPEAQSPVIRFGM